MASVTCCALLLFSSLFLFFTFPTASAVRTGRSTTVWRKKLNELVPIPDVKNNEEVQHLGQLALQAANEDYKNRYPQLTGSNLPSSELLQFKQVTMGKRGVDHIGERYYLQILSTKRDKTILGSCDVNLRKLSSDSIFLINWTFRVIGY
ncbi:hypothetical protein HPP92_002840 [Vanilla planifolia]|uniref:Uncharacterized protein n=1 Tax=Vanilla planifolia TaxID=51239 RepID=A0A835RYW3_VANPL|nr:hypothetical protein HPP92_002840 [Vanilla planifolia]